MHTDTTTRVTHPSSPTSAGRPLLAAGAKATGLAVVTVMATYLLATAVGSDLLVTGPEGTAVAVTSGTTVGMTVLGGSVGASLAWACSRWADKPRLTFLAASLLGLAAYAAVPFAAAESVATALWLNAFHVAVALPVLTILGRHLPPTR